MPDSLSDADLAATVAALPFLATIVDGVRERRDAPPARLEPLHVFAARRWAEYEGHPNAVGQVSMQVAAHGRRLVEERDRGAS